MDTFRLSKEESPKPKSRPPYPPELRRRLVQLARSGRSPAALAEEFQRASSALVTGSGRSIVTTAGVRTD